jgi:RND family efflux transporter MFP subunit
MSRTFRRCRAGVSTLARAARSEDRALQTIALAIAISWFGACSHEAPEEVETQAVVPVTVEPAQVGNIRSVVHATGVVQPAPGAELLVRPPEAGRIAEMPKAEGELVRRGDLLVRFDIPSLHAEAAAKRAEVERAEARLRNARAAQTRAHDLFERGVAARREVEDADRELTDAEAALAEARAARGASETLSERAIVRATFDGVVVARTHNPGDFVDPSATDPVLRVIDPRRLEVNASIPIPDVPGIVNGAKARLTSDGSESPVALRVIARPAAVAAGTAAAPARLAFLADTELASGTPVQVDIDAEEHTNVVIVPTTALVREGAETAVFVAANSKAQRRAVEIGATDGEHVEIRSGLKAGEPVIVHGQAGLPDGAPIQVGAPEKATDRPEKTGDKPEKTGDKPEKTTDKT